MLDLKSITSDKIHEVDDAPKPGVSPAKAIHDDSASSSSSADDITSESSYVGSPLMPPRQHSACLLARAEEVIMSKFTFGKTLGSGHSCIVKLARNNLTGVNSAVKMLNKHTLKDPTKQARVLREIRHLRMISHPHVLKLHEVVDTPDNILLFMEYVDWGTLQDYVLDYSPVAEPAVRGLFQQLVCGVAHMHSLRVVHRDIKLDNLLVSQNLTLKIADFGLSDSLVDGAFLAASCGTPHYAAPEVVAGRLYAGPEVDVWGAGVVLYALLSGALPFEADSVANLFPRILRGRYELPRRGPPGAIALLQRMLVVDQLERITVPEIGADPWFRTGLPAYLSARPVDPHPREGHRARGEQTLPLQAGPVVVGTSPPEAPVAHRRSTGPPDVAPHTPKWCLYHPHLPAPTPPSGPLRPSPTPPPMPPLSLSGPDTQAHLALDRSASQHIETAAPAPPGHWRLGVPSQQDFKTLLRHLYPLLRAEGLRWRVVDQYQLYCRELDGHGDILALHLYRLSAGEATFLVDLSILDINPLAQMELVHRLYHAMSAVL